MMQRVMQAVPVAHWSGNGRHELLLVRAHDGAWTGEITVSWRYLLLDVPEVMAATVASVLIVRRLAPRSPGAVM